MKLDRRQFLHGLGAGALGALAVPALANQAGGAADAVALPEPLPGREEEFWRAVRALYPVQADPVYLNAGGLGPASRLVLDRVRAVAEQLQEHSETGFSLLEPSREAVARFLGARPEEICFTRNATEGNCLIAAGLALRAGDEVVFESHAHPGGSFPWLNQARQRGVVVRLFEPGGETPEECLDRVRAAVTPRTRVIQVSHVTCTAGLVFPAAEIARFARERGIWFHIDGAQAAGMLPLDLTALGCDSYACSGHKWIGGPHETGIFFLRRDRLEQVALTAVGAHSGDLDHLPGEFKPYPSAQRFEYGTRSAAQIAGLAEAVRLQERIGRERIFTHGRDLAGAVLARAAKLSDLTVLTPRAESLRGAMVTVRHARATAGKLFGYLIEKHRLRCRPVTEQGLEAVRASFHVYNSPAEAERVAAGLEASVRDL